MNHTKPNDGNWMFFYTYVCDENHTKSYRIITLNEQVRRKLSWYTVDEAVLSASSIQTLLTSEKLARAS